MTYTVENIADVRRAYEEAEEFTTLPPVHPGEILREDFMTAYGMSAGAVARALDLPRSRIERIVKEEIGISTDTALRLSKLFRTTHQFWLNLQSQYESEVLLSEIGPDLDRITPVPEAA